MKLKPFLCIICSAFFFWSCESNLEKSLKMAGENRSELEKVLEHFENDPDPLKFEAAKFLIENMAPHYHPSGPAVEASDSIYLETSGVSQNVRTQYFNEAIMSVNDLPSETVSDLSEMKADFARAHVYSKPDCRECWAKFYCSGGCNANNYQYMGDIRTAHKISCQLEKKRLECAIMMKAVKMAETAE